MKQTETTLSRNTAFGAYYRIWPNRLSVCKPFPPNFDIHPAILGLPREKPPPSPYIYIIYNQKVSHGVEYVFTSLPKRLTIRE